MYKYILFTRRLTDNRDQTVSMGFFSDQLVIFQKKEEYQYRSYFIENQISSHSIRFELRPSTCPRRGLQYTSKLRYTNSA